MQNKDTEVTIPCLLMSPTGKDKEGTITFMSRDVQRGERDFFARRLTIQGLPGNRTVTAYIRPEDGAALGAALIPVSEVAG